MRSLGERILFNVYLACFVLAPVPSMWIAFPIARENSWEVASLLWGGFWFVWGIVPLSIIAIRQRTLNAFKARVEHYSGGSFRLLACCWAVGICLALLNLAELLFRT
jgi:hypothetical protein